MPGGSFEGLSLAMKPGGVQEFLRGSARTASLVGSVCIGALPLAAAGLLDGRRATTHWAFLECLDLYPKVEVVNGYPRCVVDGDRFTGGGLSSGLDTALTVAGLLVGDVAAQRAQLILQYRPKPPYSCGDPSVASYDVYRADRDGTQPYLNELRALIHQLANADAGVADGGS